MREDASGNAGRAPADAATVILLRQGENGPLVYMGKRNGHGSFAGAHVFPGGVVEPADMACGRNAPFCGPGQGAPSVLLKEPETPDDLARGVFAAAIRETFEESGVLFASRPGGAAAPGALARLSAFRDEVAAGEESLPDLARARGLCLRPDWLVPTARWITPAGARRRYDTRFFAALLPEGQHPSPDCTELVDGGWVDPAAVLAAQGKEGGYLLFPPTYVMLYCLAGFSSAQDFLAWAAGCPVYAIQPQVAQVNGRPAVLLPHDP
ncbi:MAG: NUDIX hydrolase, partial [Deltaproteobacteria bacterium]|nr:NUDIX hydrolase [Deltaproteobacteria bacterium]